MATGIEVVIESCTGLSLSGTKSEDIVPYFNYKMLGFPEHDTVFGAGKDPVFKDKNVIKTKWDQELRDALSTADLNLKCFHDGEALEESLIGEARVDLRCLADGIPIDESIPLYSREDKEVGQVKVSIQWVDRMSSKGKNSALQITEESSEMDEAKENQSRHQKQDAGLSDAVVTESKVVEASTSKTSPNEETVLVSTAESEVISQAQATATEEIEENDDGVGEDSFGMGLGIEAEGVAEGEQKDETAPEESRGEVGLGAQSFVDLETANMKLPDLSANIVIHVSKVELAEHMASNPAVDQVCVVFDFMTAFVDAKSQCTPMRPKISRVVDFSHTQVFCTSQSEANAGVREHLLAILEGGNEVESSIPFCPVAEGRTEGGGGEAGREAGESKFQDMAYCEVSLARLFAEMENLTEAQIPMMMPDGRVAATLFLSIFAVEALDALLE